MIRYETARPVNTINDSDQSTELLHIQLHFESDVYLLFESDNCQKVVLHLITAHLYRNVSEPNQV